MCFFVITNYRLLYRKLCATYLSFLFSFFFLFFFFSLLWLATSKDYKMRHSSHGPNSIQKHYIVQLTTDKQTASTLTCTSWKPSITWGPHVSPHHHRQTLPSHTISNPSSLYSSPWHSLHLNHHPNSAPQPRPIPILLFLFFFSPPFKKNLPTIAVFSLGKKRKKNERRRWTCKAYNEDEAFALDMRKGKGGHTERERDLPSRILRYCIILESTIFTPPKESNIQNS